MSKIKIITDSSCDIPRHYKDELDIAICPLSVTIDGETYREWYDITPSQFMEKLVSAKDFPKTALAGPESFLAEYKAAEEAGFDEAIVITIAASSSGTHQSAKIAAEMYEDEGGKCKITVFDSKKLSFAYGIFGGDSSQNRQVTQRMGRFSVAESRVLQLPPFGGGLAGCM